MPMHYGVLKHNKVGFHTISVKLHHRCATNLVGYAHLIIYSELYRTQQISGLTTYEYVCIKYELFTRGS